MDTNPFLTTPGEPSRQVEHYTFQVGEKHFGLRFLPMIFFEGYDDVQLVRLAQSVVYEVSFELKDFLRRDGTVVTGYDLTGTGDAFQVLGGIANGMLAWAQERRPDYLLWHAYGHRRQRLYDRMIRYFAARRGGWRRLEHDPFTGARCRPEVFWLCPISLDADATGSAT